MQDGTMLSKFSAHHAEGRDDSSSERLVERIAAGDKLAMQLLYARHHVRVYRFALRIVNDATTAEDLTSEVFLEVWKHAGRFEGRSQVSTWLLSIAATRP
jgi:RNA polymerase sigma-70 factor (ECF subfamily)